MHFLFLVIFMADGQFIGICDCCCDGLLPGSGVMFWSRCELGIGGKPQAVEKVIVSNGPGRPYLLGIMLLQAQVDIGSSIQLKCQEIRVFWSK